MGTLQVKHLPDDVHEVLRERARRQGITLSELVTRVLRREAGKPSLEEWLDALDRQPVRSENFDIQAVMDDIRGPWPDDADH